MQKALLVSALLRGNDVAYEIPLCLTSMTVLWLFAAAGDDDDPPLTTTGISSGLESLDLDEAEEATAVEEKVL